VILWLRYQNAAEASCIAVVHPAVRCPSVDTYCAFCDISVLRGRITVKFAAFIM